MGIGLLLNEQEPVRLCHTHTLLFKARPTAVTSTVGITLVGITTIMLTLVISTQHPSQDSEPHGTNTLRHSHQTLKEELRPRPTIFGYVLHVYRLSVSGGTLKFPSQCVGARECGERVRTCRRRLGI